MIKKLSELEGLIDISKSRKRLALAVSQDAFSLGALHHAYKKGIVDPVLIGSEAETVEIANSLGLNFYGARFIDEPDVEKAVKIAVQMVHDGDADILMKGEGGNPHNFKSGVE